MKGPEQQIYRDRRQICGFIGLGVGERGWKLRGDSQRVQDFSGGHEHDPKLTDVRVVQVCEYPVHFTGMSCRVCELFLSMAIFKK